MRIVYDHYSMVILAVFIMMRIVLKNILSGKIENSHRNRFFIPIRNYSYFAIACIING